MVSKIYNPILDYNYGTQGPSIEVTYSITGPVSPPVTRETGVIIPAEEIFSFLNIEMK
jgi:hypothetical protein